MKFCFKFFNPCPEVLAFELKEDSARLSRSGVKIPLYFDSTLHSIETFLHPWWSSPSTFEVDCRICLKAPAQQPCSP